MRRSFASLAPAAALLAAWSASAGAAETLPLRKAGLWESRTVSADGTSTARQCVDDRTDQLAQGGFGVGQACSKRNLIKTSTGYETETDCKIGPISAAGKGVITGDFASKVRIETDTMLTGVPNAKEPVKRRTVIEATWIGPCEPGQSPGDIILPDGKVVRMPTMPR